MISIVSMRALPGVYNLSLRDGGRPQPADLGLSRVHNKKPGAGRVVLNGCGGLRLSDEDDNGAMGRKSLKAALKKGPKAL